MLLSLYLQVLGRYFHGWEFCATFDNGIFFTEVFFESFRLSSPPYDVLYPGTVDNSQQEAFKVDQWCVSLFLTVILIYA